MSGKTDESGAQKRRFTLTRSTLRERRNTFLSPVIRNSHEILQRSAGEPPGRDTPLCAVENSPQVCCQTLTCSEKARIYVDQLLSRVLFYLSAFYFPFSFPHPRLEETRCTLHAAGLLVMAMHNIRNFSSDEAIINTEKSREIIIDVCEQ